VQYEVLGRLRLVDGDCAIELGRAKERTLADALVLHSDREVSTGRRADDGPCVPGAR
jgi:hypothetical protein